MGRTGCRVAAAYRPQEHGCRSWRGDNSRSPARGDAALAQAHPCRILPRMSPAAGHERRCAPRPLQRPASPHSHLSATERPQRRKDRSARLRQQRRKPQRRVNGCGGPQASASRQPEGALLTVRTQPPPSWFLSTLPMRLTAGRRQRSGDPAALLPWSERSALPRYAPHSAAGFLPDGHSSSTGGWPQPGENSSRECPSCRQRVCDAPHDERRPQSCLQCDDRGAGAAGGATWSVPMQGSTSPSASESGNHRGRGG
mmetsp:Transcript_38187/g.109019  ORF Transcript_38187/g.109019 Transcript_38187/m.109019 type:complete len:256 (-) Transcript_38187:654-1421(-)